MSKHISSITPNYCVIIPTYNNEKTLGRVIKKVSEITQNIIIINDGSTDETSKILAHFPQFIQYHFPQNKGKGAALQKGFELAEKEGYEAAITIDSDGQHFPEDIQVFIENYQENTVFIGSRNMKHESVPKKSSFGNRFSNFWFWFETGIWLTDTQSGFRLYPVNEVRQLKLFTQKFEFEIESIVRLVWRGSHIKNIPIQVLYDENERVSHFRPIKDFTRISILNTFLVFMAIFYIKPRDFIRKFKKKGFKKFFIEEIIKPQDSPEIKSMSIALGLFIGIAPFWGFQTFLAITLAVVFKLNKALAFTFSNISIPPMIPIIVFASLQLGHFILGTKMKIHFDNLKENVTLLTYVKEYIIGSFALAIITAFFIGLITYSFLKLNKKVSRD